MSTTTPPNPPLPSSPSPSPSPTPPSTSPSLSLQSPTVSPELAHKAAWGALIVSPLLILMPPRKLDLYTFGLLVTTCIGANHICAVRTGYGFIDGYAKYMKEISAKAAPLPPKAVEVQRRLRVERGRWDVSKQEDGEEEEEDKRGVLERLWMGNEGGDWIEKRKREEEEALAAGKTYAQIMGDFMWDAWSGGKKDEQERKAKEAREMIARSWEEERRRKSEMEGKVAETGKKGETK